jgi:hypothetical protein
MDALLEDESGKIKAGRSRYRMYFTGDEVTGGWRKLHNEELRDLCSSPSIIEIIKSMRMRWAGHVARMVEKRNVYRLLVGKSEGKRSLG